MRVCACVRGVLVRRGKGKEKKRHKFHFNKNVHDLLHSSPVLHSPVPLLTFAADAVGSIKAAALSNLADEMNADTDMEIAAPTPAEEEETSKESDPATVDGDAAPAAAEGGDVAAAEGGGAAAEGGGAAAAAADETAAEPAEGDAAAAVEGEAAAAEGDVAAAEPAAEGEEVNFEGTDEEHAAAAKIQAGFRGHKVRKGMSKGAEGAEGEEGDDAPTPAAEGAEGAAEGDDAAAAVAPDAGAGAAPDAGADAGAGAASAAPANPAASTAPAKKEKKKSKDEEEEFKQIPADYFHPETIEASSALGVPSQVLELQRSLGFDSHRRSNLHNIAPNVIMYIAGNVAVFHNVETDEQTFLRSTAPGGVGAIAIHPTRKYFAVAEKGERPPINIYEYPSMRLYRVLKEGTLKAYAHLSFNTAGDKLASVGSDPDYMLTVWNWAHEQTTLRTKAFSSDVWRVTFAAENDGWLTTSGSGHIRFWKMASTFTGMKLQGDIGKFGRSEISDIGGYVELPDGKVVSGSEWGNLLLWEGGKIKCEIARKGKKQCHQGVIECVSYEDGEIISAGADGHVRVWDMETIDMADAPSQEDMVFEMEPMMERKLANDVHITTMVKTEEEGEDEGESVYFIQDKNGTIWKADMAHSLTVKAPKSLLSFTAGKITGLDVCPTGPYVR